MRTFSATDAKQSFAALIDAAQREPIMIQRQQREVAVVISADEYRKLTLRLGDEIDALCERVGAEAKAAGLTEAKLAKLLR